MIVGIAGHGGSISSNGKQLFSTGNIVAGGAHKMLTCSYILEKGQYLTMSGWANTRIYKLN